jgi:hypothetical protein
MKPKKVRKPRATKKTTIEKRRRGRPKLTEAEKAADPLRAVKVEIKMNLKKIKKSKKRLNLLLSKAEAEQGALLSSLLESLERR